MKGRVEESMVMELEKGGEVFRAVGEETFTTFLPF